METDVLNPITIFLKYKNSLWKIQVLLVYLKERVLLFYYLYLLSLNLIFMGL